MATPSSSPTLSSTPGSGSNAETCRHVHTTHTAREAGYILIGVLILVALFFIALAVAAPIVAKSIERDKEVETVQRGKQYTRAIKLYYKRFGNYPPSLAALENTNNIRYLRKRYVDPISGKDDWRIIHIGQAKVPVYGFFGQPLQPGQGSLSTGQLGNGTGGVPGSTNGSSFGNSGSSSSPFGSSSGGFGSTNPGGGFGSSPGSSNPGDGSSTAGGGAGAPAGVIPGSGQSGGGAPGTNGTSTGTNGTTGGGSTNNTFEGGGPVVGVGIPISKKSLVIYHKQDAFNKWEFTYDPIQDQVTISSSTSLASTTGGTAGTTGGTPGTPGSSGGTPASPSSNSTFGGNTVGQPTGTPPAGTTPPSDPTTF